MNGEVLIHGQNHTHLPLLISAVLQSQGPVLEMGCGNASTPNLHALLAGSGRMLYSADSHPDWVTRFRPMANDWHRFILCPDWNGFQYPAEKFGVVLIDHAPSDRRLYDVLQLKDRADFIVIHDVEAEGYKYGEAAQHFRYHTIDRRYAPWTACVSNVRPLRVDWE